MWWMAKLDRKTFNKLTLYKDFLIDQNYKERPVDILTFITDPKYLGNTAGNLVFPVWKDHLRNIFYDNAAYQIVLTGAIGVGKSFIATMGMAYVMHLVLCARDPWGMFNKADGGKIAVVFFNLTKSLGQSKGFGLLQNHLLKSEWFRQRGTIRGEKDLRVEFDQFEYVLASPNAKGFGTQGVSLCTGILDEVDSPVESENSRMRVLKAYQSTVRRLESRFVQNDKTIGKLFLVASKQDQMSFLNVFVDDMKNSKRVYVADVPKWATMSREDLSGNKFKVAISNGYLESKLLRSTEDVLWAEKQNLQIVEIPIEFLEDFETNIDDSLRDIGGIAVKGMRKSKLFPIEKTIDDMWDTSRINPVTMPTIQIGMRDEFDLINFIDFSKINVPKNIPRFIHDDTAFSEDARGITMACCYGAIEINQTQRDGTLKVVKVPMAHVDFIMRLKAREGDHIPIHRIRKLVFDLKDRGFNICKYTSDLRLASEDTFQLLRNGGITAEYFSMDQPIGNYLDFRNIILEKRFNCFPHAYLGFELKNLEYDRSGKGKIDHPMQVKNITHAQDGDVKEVITEGSKDVSDSTAASCLNALRSAPETVDVEGMNKLFSQLNTQDITMEQSINNMMRVNEKQVISVSGQDTGLAKFQEMLKRI